MHKPDFWLQRSRRNPICRIACYGRTSKANGASEEFRVYHKDRLTFCKDETGLHCWLSASHPIELLPIGREVFPTILSAYLQRDDLIGRVPGEGRI